MHLTTDQASALFVAGLVLFALLLTPLVRMLFSAIDSVEQTLDTLITKHGRCEVLINDRVQYVGKDAMLHGFYTVNEIDTRAGVVVAHFTGYGVHQTHLPTIMRALPMTDIRVHRNGCLLTPV